MKFLGKILSTLVFALLIAGFISTTNINADDATEPSSFTTYEDSFTNEDDTKTYKISLDFTSMTTASICLVRSGKTDIQMIVTDENGDKIGSTIASANNGRRWIFIESTSNESSISTYTVSLTPINYCDTNSSFKLMYGNKNDTEKMLSGKENAVYLDTYTEKAGNQFFSYYTPDNYESWYKFIAPAFSETTFTVLTKDKNTRFKIIDYNDEIQTEVYNSAKDPNAHKTKYCSSYGYGEKVKLKTLTKGKEYFFVVYSASPSNVHNAFTPKTLNITIGKPNMLSGNATFYASGYVTGSKYTDSPTTTITVADLPSTAVVDSVTFKTANVGISMSNISYWKVMLPSESTWRTSYSQTMNIGYTKDSENNKCAIGNWKYSFRPAIYLSSLKIIPGIYISYYYELGD